MRILLTLLLLWAAPAFAQSKLAPLAAQSFDDIRRGVEALAVSGDQRAAPALEALQAGRLLVGPGNTLWIKDPAGTILNAETGEPASPPGATRPVRVNNAVRRAVDAAMGGLQLFAPEPATRAAA